MKLFNLYKIQKATTTSREFFINNSGIKCVHYGDIYKNYSFKFINSSNIINSFSKDVKTSLILKEDSIIIPDVTETVSDYGHPTYIKYDGTPYINGTHALAITSNGGNLKYLFYYLQNPSNIKRLQSLLLGSTVFGISIKDFEKFELIEYEGDRTCQQHIVDIIGSIDDKIENNNQIIEKIWNYLELFHTCYKNENNKYNYNITQIAEIKYGKSIPTSNIQKNGKYPVYGSNGIIGFLDNYEYEKHKIAISCRGNSSGIIHLTQKNSTITSNSLVLNFFDKKYTYYFYLEFCNKGLYEFKTGSAQPQITIDNLSKLSIDIVKNIDKYNNYVPIFVDKKFFS